MRKALGIAIAAGFAIAVLVAGSANGSRYAGSGGRIAFIRTSPDGSSVTLMVANPDGSRSQDVPVANRPETFSFPAWSPDGTWLLISHTFRLKSSGSCCKPFRPATVNPNGSRFFQLTMPYAPPSLDCPVWASRARYVCQFNAPNAGVFSVQGGTGADPKRLIKDPYGNEVEAGDLPTGVSPDRKHLLFIRFHPGRGAKRERDKMTALFVANRDGTGVRQITPFGLTAAHEDTWAAWSPDGREILAVQSGSRGHPGPITCIKSIGACLATSSRLFTIRPDGSRFHAIRLQLPASIHSYRVLQPSWSPDGSRIIFGLWPAHGHEDIYTAKPNGSDVIRVTHTRDFECAPRWG